jgi:hypothetical protein
MKVSPSKIIVDYIDSKGFWNEDRQKKP